MTFIIKAATLVVDDEASIQLASRINMRAITFEALTSGNSHASPPYLVVCQDDSLGKLREIISRGISHADAKCVDFAGGPSFSDLVTTDIPRLRALFSSPLGILSDRVRLLHQWPEPLQWQPILTGDEAFDSTLRWRPRMMCSVVGDYGSGKSTFAQMLALKLLAGPTLWPSVNAKGQAPNISVCAWEDDTKDFKDRIKGTFGMAAEQIERRVWWFEPDADEDRMLDEYLNNVEQLCEHENTLIHVCDPWNSFNHETGSETETKYAQKVLTRMQKITRKWNCTIIMVTHLPKHHGNARKGLRVFRIGDAAGTKEFGNKSDLGFCVSRTPLIASAIQDHMDEDSLKDLNTTPQEVLTAVAEYGHLCPTISGKHMVTRGGVAVDKYREHMLVVTDKIKAEGFGPTKMGIKTVKAFVIDPDTSKMTLDPVATHIALRAWR